MFRILFYYFAPALVPILIYVAVYYAQCFFAKRNKKSPPKFMSKKLHFAFMVSLGIAILTFIILFGIMSGRTIENI